MNIFVHILLFLIFINNNSLLIIIVDFIIGAKKNRSYKILFS